VNDISVSLFEAEFEGCETESERRRIRLVYFRRRKAHGFFLETMVEIGTTITK
jgi:hypothetical protein